MRVPCVLFRQRSVQAFRDEVDAQRNASNSALFLRYARLVGARRPPLAWLARTYLEHRGLFYWHFTNAAAARARAADDGGARRALMTALRISPMHAVNDLRRPSPLRSTLRTLVTASVAARSAPKPDGPARSGRSGHRRAVQ